MDKIFIEDLKIFANHGVLDFEKLEGQNFYISACLYTDIQKAGLSDDLSDTVNYAAVCDKIAEFTKDNSFDLIETLAEKLSIYLLNEYKTVNRIDITVKKPEAPIEHTFGNVSVSITRKRHIAYIAFGSNLGDSKKYIEDSKAMIEENISCSIISESSIYTTSAYGIENQPDFLNGIWAVETYLEPFNLLDFLHEVEKAGGRERKEHWGPRTIDLDIIMYDDLVLDTEYLTIPHSDMANRDFVLGPFAEIAGFVRHPLTGKTIREMSLLVKESHIK